MDEYRRPSEFQHKLENASLDLLDASVANFTKWLSSKCYANPNDIPLFLPHSSFSYRYGPHFWTVTCVGYEIISNEELDGSLSPSSSLSTITSSLASQIDDEKPAPTPNHAVYCFAVTRGAERRIVRYRFSEILRLIAALTGIPRLGAKIGEVAAPLKQPWKLWGRFDESFLEARVTELNRYFEKMLRLHISISSLHIIRWFFDLDSFDKRLWFYSFATGGHPTQNTKELSARVVNVDQYLMRFPSA